jgi:hypothetical protein
LADDTRNQDILEEVNIECAFTEILDYRKKWVCYIEKMQIERQTDRQTD